MFLRNLGISAALCLVLVAGRTLAADDPTLVAVDAVRLQPINETISVIGRFLSTQKGIVATQTEGAVAQVFVDVGDRVTTGTPLIQLVTDRLALRRDEWKAQLQDAKAQLVEAKASLALEQQNLDRVDDLENSAAFSQARKDDQQQKVAIARAVVASASAAVARAQASLDLAQVDLEGGTVRAPYDGVVVLRHTEVGSYLDGGDSVVTMVNDTAMEVEADVPSSSIAGLVPGVVVDLVFDDGTRRKARVRAVGVAEEALSRTRPVRFTPDWTVKPGELADGQSVTVEVPVAHAEKALTVSKDAVLRDGGHATVFVVEDGIAKVRAVKLGSAVGDRFIVLAGLQEGEVVVVRGNEFLDNDTPVTIQDGGS